MRTVISNEYLQGDYVLNVDIVPPTNTIKGDVPETEIEVRLSEKGKYGYEDVFLGVLKDLVRKVRSGDNVKDSIYELVVELEELEEYLESRTDPSNRQSLTVEKESVAVRLELLRGLEKLIYNPDEITNPVGAKEER